MNVQEVAERASKSSPRGLDKAYFTREEVVALCLRLQDRIVEGLRMRKERSTEYLQADAYEQAARVVLSTPIDPKDA